MKIIFIVTLFLTITNLWALDEERQNVLSQVDVHITDMDKKLIALSPSKKAINKRLMAYDKLLKKSQNRTIHEKITLVNNFFNKFDYISDQQKYNQSDYWATKKEFLLYGKGDCEDYAIAKYTTLLALGFNKANLSLYKTVYKGKGHIIVVYHDNRKQKDYVLDSMNQKILSLVKRNDLKRLIKIV